MRSPPLPAPKLEPGRRDDRTVLLTRQYRLLTPLFGGGVEPQTADPVTLARGPGIRGHLRFWWRATRGGAFDGDLGRMRAAEMSIWGSAATKDGGGPSCVSVRATATNEGRAAQPYTLRPGRAFPDNDRSVAPGYAAFPLQPTRERPEPRSLRVGVELALELRFPRDLQAEVLPALWAWETFGGIGARTRRGFGALEPAEPLEPATGDPAAWLERKLRDTVAPGPWPDGVPHLPRAAERFRLTPLEWAQLIERYKDFRQRRNEGKQHNRPGRSRWPEPDVVRKLTGDSAPLHATPIHTPPIEKFPRAAFGLPIIFHFQGGGDPRDTTLQGHDHDRLASPLILRPTTIGGRTHGLALVLDGPRTPPGGLKLTKAPREPRVEHELTPGEAERIEALDGQTDVLQAFLDSLPGGSR